MYGAIFGDIIGSRFEFDRGVKTKKFTLFTEKDNFTDDTVMTIAVADGLLRAGKNAAVNEIHEAVTSAMRSWGRKYPNAGYGGRFYEWLFCRRDPKPYGSYGNGSAMRVSAAGWLYDSLERTREAARATAEVTHDHPEGIKGAECTAAVIYMGRTGHCKAEIRDYVDREFGYDLSESLEQLRARHRHVESCQDSLPKALVSFFTGESYEDVVRNAVSLGGDTDTLAAIAGAMAEAFYGIPIRILAEGLSFLPEDMVQVLHSFNEVLGRTEKEETHNKYEDNLLIKHAISEVYKQRSTDLMIQVLCALAKRMDEGGEVPAPMVDANHVLDRFNVTELSMGDTFSFPEDLRLLFDTMQDAEGNQWIPLFTDEDELNKGETANIRINVPIEAIISNGSTDKRVRGVVINPFGQSLVLPKDILRGLAKVYPDDQGCSSH